MKSSPTAFDETDIDNEKQEWHGFLEYSDLARMSAASRCCFMRATGILVFSTGTSRTTNGGEILTPWDDNPPAEILEPCDGDLQAKVFAD